ncbi:MAG: hypothetical protein EXR77_09855 [Myxococcales bacterium]|nr:hypothetical protein [Myxococcales bacterium]
MIGSATRPSELLPTAAVPVALGSVATPTAKRGMVLIMALLMIGMLAMLGSAAALRTAMDLREGGAERTARAAYRISEAGTVSVLSLATQMQAGFGDYVNSKSNSTLTLADVGDSVLNLSSTDGSFGMEMAAVGGISFETAVQNADAATAVPGYDAARYCFRTYQMVTTSRLGSATPKNLVESLATGQTQLQSSMTVGPVPCAQ